ncbi:MAG: histidine kinase [Lachnospiraceae bacterium]|nr:histidine kinase [Lachnospiraceae bacterium]
MKRRTTALLIIILLPLIYVTVLFFLNKSIQPVELNVARSDEPSDTLYFDTAKFYALSGEIICFPGELLSPTSGDYTAVDDFITNAKQTHDFFYASAFSDYRRPQSVVGNDYIVTLAFNTKLPSETEYSIWFPAEFCEYRIFVNGELVSESPTFNSTKPIFPKSFVSKLPPTADGYYTVVAQVISPVNYINSCPDTAFFATSDRLHWSQIGEQHIGLFMAAYVIFTMVYMLIQLLALRFESVIVPFVCLSGMTCIVMAFMDDRCIMSFIPTLTAGTGSFVEAVAEPLYLLSLMYFTAGLFKESFPKRISYFVSVLLLFPLVNALTLQQFPLLGSISTIVFLIPYIMCGYTFVKAYEKNEPNAIPYGISLALVASNLILYRLTFDMLVPSKFAYSMGYIVLSIAMVTILGREYAAQNANENFYTSELSRQLEAMQASENAFLNAQMKPHFLYNTLNTIADCCVTDSKKAQKLINSLSEYLKLILSLDNMDKTVPIRHELELVEAYTAIEKERFPSIMFANEFPLRVPNIMMPPITIQPLIENAIKHGVRKSDKPGVVTLRIIENLDSVEFFVSDNGVGMDEAAMQRLFVMPKENQSIGIYNIDKRLKNQYGQGLHVESTPGLGTCVSFKIPKVT